MPAGKFGGLGQSVFAIADAGRTRNTGSHAVRPSMAEARRNVRRVGSIGSGVVGMLGSFEFGKGWVQEAFHRST